MAQNVYSVNVVGYVNVVVKPGYNLIANQLVNTAGNNLNQVLTNATPGIADGTSFQKFDTTIQDFSQADYFFSGSGWVDGGFLPSTNSASPGEGIFINNVGPQFTLTLVGEVKQGTNAVPVHSGYSFISDSAPISTSLTTNGFPALADGSSYQTFDSTTQDYSQAVYYFSAWVDGGFLPASPTPAVGQAFVIFNTGPSASWSRVFTVQ